MKQNCILILLLIGLGCASRTQLGAPPTSAFHQSLNDLAPDFLNRRLQNEGWQIEILDRTRHGQSAINPGEEWNQTVLQIRFRAQRDQSGPVVLTPEQSGPILAGVRADLRKLIQHLGGEVLETVEGEAYRERTLAISYKLERLAGLVVAKLGPASDLPEETNNRLELTIREQN